MMVRNTAQYLIEAGMATAVVTPRAPGRCAGAVKMVEYASLAFPGHAPYRMGAAWFDRTIRRRIGSIPFDIVHAHCPFSSGTLALATARSRGVPIVATMHSRYLEDLRRAVRVEWVARWFLARIVAFYDSVDEVWVPNESTRSVLESYGYDGPITVQRNGTEIDRPDSVARDRLRAAGRMALGIPDTRTVALYVGQQRVEKNVGLIIGALGRMKRYGTPTPLTGLIRERDRLKELYAASDFFVFPSTYDTDGIVVTEAAAFAIDTLSRDASFRAELGGRASVDLYRSAREATAEAYERYTDLVDRSRTRREAQYRAITTRSAAQLEARHRVRRVLWRSESRRSP